jgi:UDP-N-acetylmuramoyl-tripeptide--D-alanyl-D-alanine ligase
LGENEVKYHSELGEYINSKKNLNPQAKVISIGNLSKNITDSIKNCETKHFETIEDAIPYIKSNITPPTTLFLKASRSMKFEKIIELLKQNKNS